METEISSVITVIAVLAAGGVAWEGIRRIGQKKGWWK